MLTFRVCYVLSALVAVPVSFLRLFDPVESGGIRRTYDRNLYELADAGFAVDEIALALLDIAARLGGAGRRRVAG